MRYVISAMLIVAAIIHLTPLAGVLGASRLSALYGLEMVEPNLLILMRHRAVLFGLLGVFLLAAAFKPALQPAALAGGLISVVSFLWLTLATGSYNAQIARIFAADVVALGALVIAAIAMSVQSHRA
jgi:hypothetical protein